LRASGIEIDLIVIPQPLDEPANPLGSIRSRRALYIYIYIFDRALAVDGGKDARLGRIDREREVGIGMRSIDQNGGGADS